jgi:hypothetical protein
LELPGNLEAGGSNARSRNHPKVFRKGTFRDQKFNTIDRKAGEDSPPSAMGDHSALSNGVIHHERHAVGMADQRCLSLLHKKSIARESIPVAMGKSQVFAKPIEVVGTAGIERLVFQVCTHADDADIGRGGQFDHPEGTLEP